ncbi:MAG: hypothetical protein WCO00_01490 [Rhodospirillaceae bacterium]
MTQQVIAYGAVAVVAVWLLRRWFAPAAEKPACGGCDGGCTKTPAGEPPPR